GLAGGRNDLMLFEFNGRKILFEIIASYSQVSRDLRILDKTKADIKIAVIIDKEVDKCVFEKFLKENPEDNYPFIFIGELFKKSNIYQCALKLNELISGEEEAIFLRILNQKLSRSNFIESCKREGIDVLSIQDIESKNVTFRKVFLTIVLNKLNKISTNRQLTRGLMKWMSDKKTLEFIFMKVGHGFNTFLYTDLGGNKGIYSDIELLDWLRIGYENSAPYILLSMNAVISEIFQKYYKSAEFIDIGRKVNLFVGQSDVYDSNGERIVTFSIPKKTTQIKIFRPMVFSGDEKEKLGIEKYYNMIEII
ncbi:MAG: hypothetical protein ACNYWU_10570, partial [Desulfobacterales bacterium]